MISIEFAFKDENPRIFFRTKRRLYHSNFEKKKNEIATKLKIKIGHTLTVLN